MGLDTTHSDERSDPVSDFRLAREATAPAGVPVGGDPPEHNLVFTSLVTGDKDIVGLVAYSIYKQNKYDWLMAFSRHEGRTPNSQEVQSYLHGEGTSRRLATYRHLAEATLDGRGLEVPGSPSRPSPSSRALPFGATSESRTGRAAGRPLLIGLIIVILVVIGFVWVFHGGSVPK